MTEPVKPQPSSPHDDELDVRELLRSLWGGKWIVGGITVVGAVIAVIVALMLPNIYRSEALLTPNQDEGAGGLSSLAAQYGGLATLAGINLGSGSSDKTALGLEILKSRKFISSFIQRHDILVPVMAAYGWDPATGELKIDSEIYDVLAKKWVREPSPPRKTIPTLLEAYGEFTKEFFSVSQDKKTGFVRVSIQHYSPTVAKKWVDWLVQDVNATVMRQEVAEAEQAIAYLKQQIASTSLADLQNVFFKLIEEQTKTIMLAKVSPEYIFRTVDPAVVPELKAKPKRASIAFLGLFFGGFLGAIVVLFRRRAGSNSREE